MGNKFKLLITLIILTGLGIAIALGAWLYGSYNSRKDLFLSAAERSLFNSVQEVYQTQNHTEDGVLQVDPGFRKLLGEIAKQLSKKMSAEEVRLMLNEALKQESVHAPRTDGGSPQHRHLNSEEQNSIIPPFLFQHFEMNTANRELIKQKFDESLKQRKIAVSYQLEIIQIPREKVREFRRNYREKNLTWTRPVLVNPAKNQFVIVKFDRIWNYLLFDLGWQVILSLILISLLLGTFFYSLRTILKQNKLAKLRKAFVDNMTHELKTPVSTVMAAVEAIQKYGARDDREKMDRYLSISRRELDHLSNMIEKVLQMDVDESQGLKLHKAAIDLVEIIHSSAEVFRLNNKKEVDITVSSVTEKILIVADESHVKNVVSNLLENAIKYGGDPVQIKIDIRDVKENVEFRITDNGKGIPASYHKQIFDMFFRVPSGDLHDVKGFGLGLAYVRQVVEQHAGTIRLESEEGKGSTFIIVLPKN